MGFSSHAQNKKSIDKSRINLPDYDNRLLTYGFSLGLHASAMRPKFSEGAFNIYNDGTPETSLAVIETPYALGFSIGFLGSLRAAQYLDIRFMPKVTFVEYNIRYYETSSTTNEWEVPAQQADFTTLDLPLSVKFKSSRRANQRMFLTAGVTPILNVSGKKKSEETSEFLSVNGNNLTADIGFGVDLYFPLFKFSPEFRYSYGIPNLKNGDAGKFDPNFSGIGTQIYGLYLVFN